MAFNITLEQVQEFFATHFEGIGEFVYKTAHDEARDLELIEVHFLLNGDDVAYFVDEESDLQRAQMRFVELIMKHRKPE